MQFTLTTSQKYQTLREAIKTAKPGDTIFFQRDDCGQIMVGQNFSVFSSPEDDHHSIRKDGKVIYTGPCERWDLTPTDKLVIQSAGKLLVLDPENPQEDMEIIYQGPMDSWEVHRSGLLIYLEQGVRFRFVIW